MPRDIERARDETRSAMAPDAAGDRVPEPDNPGRARARAPSKMPAIPADPELLHFRARLDQQLATWRDSRPGTSVTAATKAPTPRFGWHARLVWIPPIAACGAAAFAGWWISSAPAVRAGAELAQVRQALQEEQYKSEKLVATLAAAWRDLGAQAAALADKDAHDREREALQKALHQSEEAAAAVAQSLAEERLHSQELGRQLAVRSEATGAAKPGPAADATTDKPPAETPDPDPELLRLLSRANLLVARGDISAARAVLDRAAETGSALALFALAETFDPAILSAWGTVGTQGDPAWAGDLYAKALAGGIAAAKDRLATLGR